MIRERELTPKVDQTIEGFVIYPSQDEGPAFFRTSGLPEEKIDVVKESLRRQRQIGSIAMLKRIIDEYPGRLVHFQDMVDQFRRIDRVTRIRIQIEEIIPDSK